MKPELNIVIRSMLRLAYVLCFTLFFVKNTSFAHSNVASYKISEIFIEASGNNKFEAKVKAHELGMRRALHLVLDKISIPDSPLDVGSIPYGELKEIFTHTNTKNELSLCSKYSATVSYSYKIGKLYQLLLESEDSKISDLFFELLVLPAFKKNNELNIWNKAPSWNQAWDKFRNVLADNSIIYPNKTIYLSQKITPKNLEHLQYEDFINIFHEKYFKQVLIITAEFLVDKETLNTVLSVEEKFILPDASKQRMVTEYYDLDNMQDVPSIVSMIVNDIVKNYGSRKVDTQQDAELLQEKHKNERMIVMHFDALDEKEINAVTSKLEKIEQIDDFQVDHKGGNKYKIILYTTADEYTFAESLYFHGLSYKIHGKLYNLIDLKRN